MYSINCVTRFPAVGHTAHAGPDCAKFATSVRRKLHGRHSQEPGCNRGTDALAGGSFKRIFPQSAVKSFDKLPKAVDFVSQSDVPVEHLPLIVAILTFLIAGVVKGVIGLGLPTVSMGLLSLVMAPAKAASLLIVPSFVTNVWQLAAGPSFGRLARRLWPMLAGVVVGALAGTGLLTGSHAGQAAVALGFLLMLYAALGLTSVRFSVAPAAEWWLGPLIGALTGPRHRRDRRVCHPSRALSRVAQSGQGGHDPGAGPVLHSLDHRARRLRSRQAERLRLATLALQP